MKGHVGKEAWVSTEGRREKRYVGKMAWVRCGERGGKEEWPG